MKPPLNPLITYVDDILRYRTLYRGREKAFLIAFNKTIKLEGPLGPIQTFLGIERLKKWKA